MRAHPTGIASSPFAELPTAVGRGSGVIATERDGLGIARIEARRGRIAEVVQVLDAKLGVTPPNAPRCAWRDEVAIGGIGPNTWIAVHASAGNLFAQSLQPVLGHCASVTDQSDAYVILRLAGPRVRETLAKLVPIDVHPRAFPVSAVAQTVCGYVSVTLWRLEDGMQGDPMFEIWAGRSLAASLHQAICHGAAEFGFVRQTR
jgi:sarcosine oxidase subunit gamma